MPRAVVTGGCGFLGSHVTERLVAQGWQVAVVDDLSTGRRDNVAHLPSDAVSVVEHDVVEGIPVTGTVDAVLHFASPASPPVYLAHPLETLAVGSVGTKHALDLAVEHGARFLLASTSEIYGDPLEHPQREEYRGNVSTTGVRAVYDEAKRYAEALTMAYHRVHDLDTKIVRIFNTFGERLQPGDGRVVSNFLAQALRGEPLTIYGDGTQTRSFCYVDDEVTGIVALLESAWTGPMNIGNPAEVTVLELAELVREIVDGTVGIVHEALPDDDPVRRCPDITLAMRVLGWKPQITLREGLARTLDWYRASVA
jgi:dTDP-glucose 4,6-dehydratase